MTIPTEPIGSIPRPHPLIEAIAILGPTDPALDALYDDAVRDTIDRFAATGSPVVTDGEQRKYHNFWTYASTGCRTRPRTGSRSLLPPGTSAGCRD